MEMFKVAWRNVFRNKRRTTLNVIALSIGIIMIILGIGWMRGYETGLFNSMINFDTGHIQILNEKYLDEQRRYPLDYTVSGYEALSEAILSDPRILEVTPRINFTLKMGFRGNSRYVLARGIDPRREAHVTVLKKFIVGGNYLDKAKGILVGKPLAEKFGLSVGDPVSITAMNKYSVENLWHARVAGIFNFGYPVIDDNMLYMDLETANNVLTLQNEATRLVIKLKPGYTPQEVLPAVQELLHGTQFRAYTWDRFAEVVVSAVQADGSSFGFIFLIMYILIIIGIRNSMSMSVQERVREIGTLRAIGMRKSRLLTMFLAESVCISLIAVAVGLLVGGIIAFFLQYQGFNLGDYLPEDIPLPFGEKFTADFRWYDFLFALGFGSVTAVLAALKPARRASKIIISKAMASLAVK